MFQTFIKLSETHITIFSLTVHDAMFNDVDTDNYTESHYFMHYFFPYNRITNNVYLIIILILNM